MAKRHKRRDQLTESEKARFLELSKRYSREIGEFMTNLRPFRTSYCTIMTVQDAVRAAYVPLEIDNPEDVMPSLRGQAPSRGETSDE